MWRLSLALLVALPPVAIALNHDVISAILIISWTMIVIPVCFMHMMDALGNLRRQKKGPVFEMLLRAPLLILGALSAFFGASIVIWCLYNVCIQVLPEYSGPKSVVDLLAGGFGIGPMLVIFGVYLVRLACHKGKDSSEIPRFE